MTTRYLTPFRLVAPLVALLATGMAAQQAATKIAARDQLQIRVVNAGVDETNFSGKFPVDSDGTFEYPTLGRVKAVDLTTRELETDLKARLEKYLVSPQVTIEVEQTTAKKVIISGQVRTPAAYQFSGQLTLLEALTRAGTVSDDAGDEAIIHHQSTGASVEEPVRVDLYDLLKGQSMQSNVVLRDGDTIFVPKSEPAFISGFVQAPGPIHVRRDTTVLQALSMAGGVTDRGSMRSIKIQRTIDGKKKDIPVKNVNTDIVKPGDTVVVSARIF